MGLDLTMAIVPKEIESLFEKAKRNNDYAEWIAFILNILNKGAQFTDFGDELIKEMKRDVAQLKEHYPYDSSCNIYDEGRCASSIDFLLNQYIDIYDRNIEKDILWQGGDIIAYNIVAGQGGYVKLYKQQKIKEVNDFISHITFSDLEKFYSPETMEEAGVYKLTYPHRIWIMEEMYHKFKALFLKASNITDASIIKIID